MSIKTYITNPDDGTLAEVKYNELCDCNAITVATIPRRTFNNVVKPFLNPTYGEEMAQSAGPSGSPTPVHNGGDDVLWTASVIATIDPDFDFESTDYAHTGTQSIDCTDAEVNDIFQLQDPSGSHSLSQFDSLTGWVYITGNWTPGSDGCGLYLWDTTTGLQSSPNTVNIDNYINAAILNTWQQFVIPVEDFGVSNTFNAVRGIIIREDGFWPDFYLDDIQFETTDGVGTLKYTVKPDPGTWLYVHRFNIFMADAYDSTITNGTMPGIPYDALLGVPALDSGIVYQRIQDDEIQASSSIKQFSDILTTSSNPEINGYGYDGTNTWVSISILFTEEVVLKYELRDEMRLTISENLSGLLTFKVNAGCREEEREL